MAADDDRMVARLISGEPWAWDEFHAIYLAPGTAAWSRISTHLASGSLGRRVDPAEVVNGILAHLHRSPPQQGTCLAQVVGKLVNQELADLARFHRVGRFDRGQVSWPQDDAGRPVDLAISDASDEVATDDMSEQWLRIRMALRDQLATWPPVKPWAACLIIAERVLIRRHPVCARIDADEWRKAAAWLLPLPEMHDDAASLDGQSPASVWNRLSVEATIDLARFAELAFPAEADRNRGIARLHTIIKRARDRLALSAPDLAQALPSCRQRPRGGP